MNIFNILITRFEGTSEFYFDAALFVVGLSLATLGIVRYLISK